MIPLLLIGAPMLAGVAMYPCNAARAWPPG
jgi:hypothetical protein